MSRPNVFAIPAGAPFLPTLADAVLTGQLGAVGAAERDPMALASITILLPTRRSVRALRQIFVQRSPGKAAILPRIRTIGDVDEEDFLLQPVPEDPADALVLPPAVSRLERSLVLTQLVLAWGRTVRRSLVGLGPDQPLLIPASSGDAVRLAADLARLIDDMETSGVDWDALKTLTPDDYPAYWQLTLDFLKIAGEHWPAYLAERRLADPVVRRDRLIRLAAQRLKSMSTGPVIAAGSTGSIPATAELLRAIANLPDGAVVLPGLDVELDAGAWKAIGDPAEPNTGAPSHPQFGLKHLLARLGVQRADVEPLAADRSELAGRSAIIREAMRPAETTDAWAAASVAASDEAFDGVSLLVARNEQEEALAIAVALRESAESQSRVAALVTPDRTLARRVAVELGRWGIRVDDSAGQPLDTTVPGVFARLVAQAALTGDAVHILALLKHPLAAFGMPRFECRRAARILEIALLRGPGASGNVDAMEREVIDIRFGIEMKVEQMPPRARRRFIKADWARAEAIAAALSAALRPLAALRLQSAAKVSALTTALVASLEQAANDGTSGLAALWGDAAGAALAKLLTGLLDGDGIEIAPAEIPGFLQAAMAGATVVPPAGADPRVHIWGGLEGRLQTVDLLVLGGLDEGIWPAETRTDPWLSRQMRQAIGLASPERRIGLAAHDFSQAMMSPTVVVSRAEKRGGAPTVPSRWLQRLGALIGPDRLAALSDRGRRYVDLARALDRVRPDEVVAIARPNPKPPLDARPRELSVTSIENLIRDPYSVYARRILQLEPLDPIGQRADARIRGNLIHEALASFTKEWLSRPFDRAARERLLELWRDQFSAIAAFPEVHAVWTLLAPRIADWIVAWEAGRDTRVATRYAEIKGDFAFDAPAGPFKLTGRADRIDLMVDGTIGIYDYKTGAPPSARQVLLFQPQLALEGAMVQAGAFGQIFQDRSIAELAWIGLARVGKDDPLRSAVDDGWTADAMAIEAMARLGRLVAAYDDPEHGYASQARPMFERRFPGDYDHLARVSEWRLAARTAE